MPAEVTCEHCGASVVVPRDGDAAGVTCTYCEQWIVLRKPLIERREQPSVPVRTFNFAWLLLPLGIAGAAGILLTRGSSSAPAPPSVTTSAAPSASVSMTVALSASVAPPRSYLRALDSFDASGNPAHDFDGPTAIAVDGASSVWVADRKTPTVRKFDPHGKLLLTIPSGLPERLVGLAADAKGNVFLSFRDQGAPIQVRAGDDGRLVRTIPPAGKLEIFEDLAVDQTGALYAVVDDDAHGSSWVVKMDATGKVLGRLERSKQDDLVKGKPAIDGDGRVFVPHLSKSLVYVHDVNGTIENRWGSRSGEGALGDQLGGLVCDFHGHVLVASRGVLLFDTDGRYLQRALPGQDGQDDTSDLALAPDGTLYVVTHTGAVQHYALDPTALAK